MSEILFSIPRQIAFEIGVTVPGALANFYAAGTSTRQDTFTDSDLTTAHANPVVADANGQFAPIYLDRSKSYKVDITNSAGASLTGYPVDSITAALTAGEVGSALYPLSAAEIAAGLTDTEVSAKGYIWGELRRYGMADDGSSGAETAWDRADLQSDQGGFPITVPAIANGVLIATPVTTRYRSDVLFIPGAKVTYTGIADIAAITLGGTDANGAFGRTYKNIWVERQTQSDWSSENNIGVLCKNAADCLFDIRYSSNFTIALQLMGDTQGFQLCEVIANSLHNSKIGIDFTNDNGGFCNGNHVTFGRISVFSGVQATNGAVERYGLRFNSLATTKSYCNSNTVDTGGVEGLLFGSADGIAVEMLYAIYNNLRNIRDEGNTAPFMRTANLSEWNTAYDVTVNLLASVENNGTYKTNFVYPAREHSFNQVTPTWSSPVLPRVANEYDGAGQIYIPGCSQRNSSNGNQNKALTLLVVADDYLEIPSTRGVGVMVDTGNIKRFNFRKDVEAGFGGRLVVIPYDTNKVQLTTDGSYVAGTGGSDLTHTSNVGGAYQTGADSNNDHFFSVSSDVHFIWVGIFGGTAVARLRSFQLQSLDNGSLTVFQGFTDVNGKFFHNDYRRYATVIPATSALGINYAGGDVLYHDELATAEIPSFHCTAEGNPGSWENAGVVS